MTSASFHDRLRTTQLNRDALAALQLDKLNRLLASVAVENAFYRKKLSGFPAKLESLDQLPSLPQTTKDELQPASGDDPFAANRTHDVERYVRCHQTSGTRGRPLVVLDTAEDWRWWARCWQYVLDAAEITERDRALLAFSFGPFVGFWSAFDALTARGVLVLPGGGMTSLSRLETIRQAGVTTLLCTPSYALRLAEVAAEHSLNLAESTVEKIIVAGEPGGSVPATRERIEAVWNARVIDHAGATEVGPWGFADAAGRGLHVNEAEFVAEFVSVETGRPAEAGELSELILTALGRMGAPVIRYRTADLVRPVWQGDGPCRFVLLDGGVLGRSDDMVIVRGMNIYPTAIEQIMHSFPEVVEYRVTARRQGALDELVVEVEDHLQQPARIADELQLKLGLKVDVRCVTAMSLPRFEGKGQRFIDER
jgi:phenylacetate-CoA ligase